ncbi:hypothetical protein HN51_025602, partial [Arachis hypogaea]
MPSHTSKHVVVVVLLPGSPPGSKVDHGRRPNARPGLVRRTMRMTDIRAAGVSCAGGNATSPSNYLEGASRGRGLSVCVHSGGASRCAQPGSRLDLRW